jgi:hypothetical protein
MNDLLTDEELRWGHPPVGFLSQPVAEALNGVEFPREIADALGLSHATALDLTSARSPLLRGGEPELGRIGDALVSFVEGRLNDLTGVPLVGGPMPAQPELAVRRWPARPRNILLRTGLAARADRLSSATVGSLLKERMVGVRAVLEISALLEASGLLEPSSPGSTQTSRPASFVIGDEPAEWGTPPAPLLPESLRELFGEESLPTWVRKDLGLPDDATSIALDKSVWKRVDSIPPRIKKYLVGLVTYRGSEIHPVRVLTGGWRGGNPSDVAWPNRVRNALEQTNLLDEYSIVRVTYGELLSVSSLGPKSVLEFAVIAEQASSNIAAALNKEQQDALLAAAKQPWADRIRADDVRFREAAPAYDGTFSDLFEEALANPQGDWSWRVVEGLPAIQKRVAEIDSAPLEAVLPDVLRSMSFSERDIAIIVRRMGWDGRPPASLQKVGDEFRITRERVRQVVDKLTRKRGPRYIPALERAITALDDQAPVPTSVAATSFVERGIASIPFQAAGVLRAAETFGYECDLTIGTRDGIDYVQAPGDQGISAVLRTARNEAGRVGVSNADEVQAELSAEGRTLSDDVVRRLLGTSPKVVFLTGDWFWMPDIPPGRNRLRNTTRLMLSVSPRLSLQSVRHGLRRRYRWRHIDLVPPLEVLREFYRANPEFEVDSNDNVTSNEPLDYRKELGDAERVFVEVLRAVPTGLLDRAELEATVTGRGVNPSTFGVYTTFSPILDHPALNVWCLRGHDVDPAAIQALKDIVATREPVRRTIRAGWDADGRLSITTILGSVSSPVILIPASVSRYVSGRSFHAVTQEGSPAGTVTLDERGTSWGYGPFLRRRGAESGDALTISFDLAAETATLLLVDDSDLLED